MKVHNTNSPVTVHKLTTWGQEIPISHYEDDNSVLKDLVYENHKQSPAEHHSVAGTELLLGLFLMHQYVREMVPRN